MRKRSQRNRAYVIIQACVEEVRSRVLLGRRRAVERPDPSGGIIRVEGDAGDIFHELLSCWDRVDR